MAILQSSLKISVIDAATSRLRAIGSAIGALHRRGNAATMMPVGGAISRLAAFAGAYVGVTGGIRTTVGAARDMQAQLTEIGIKADLSTGQLAQLRNQMRSLSGATNQTTTDLLGGVDAMVTLGLDADRAAAAMPAIGKAATATMSSVTDLSAASVAAMQNMKVTPGEIGKMLDAMTSAGNQGAFEVRDMAREFPALTASAKSLGIEGVAGITDMSAALQIARRGAGDASTAANNMSNFLQKIMAPRTIANFKKFGVDVTKELKKAHKNGISPIEHFIKLVDEKTEGGRADLLGQLFGDKQVLEFVRPMLADFKDYLKIRGDAERASGTVAAAYEQRMKDANQQVKSFRIQMENLGEALGETALKPLGDFAGGLANILKTLGSRVGVFDKLKASMEGFMGGLGLSMPEGGVSGWLERNFFGEEFKGSSRDVDERVNGLARLSNRFREIGRNIRQFAEDVADNPIAKFLGGLVGQGFKLMLASAGIGMLASAIWKLGRAMAFLSGLTAAVGIIKGLGRVGGLLVNGKPGGNPGKPSTPAGSKLPGAKDVATGGAILTAFGSILAGLVGVGVGAAAIAEFGPGVVQKGTKPKEGTPAWWLGIDPTESRQDRLDRLNHRPSRGGPLTRGRDRGDVERDDSLGAFLDFSPAKQKVDRLNAALTSATSEWPAAAQTGIRAYVDALAAGGGQAEAEADRIGGGIKDALSVTGQPQIDTSQLSRALEIARQLGEAIRSAGSTRVNLPATRIDGARAKGGPVRRGGRYLVGEEGPELLDMGVGGFIHDARSTGAMLRKMAQRTALASAAFAMPAAPALAVPQLPTAAFVPPAQARQAPNINIGGVTFTIHAAPGQSPQEVAAAVERALSAKLNALSRGAFSDGVA